MLVYLWTFNVVGGYPYMISEFKVEKDHKIPTSVLKKGC